MLERLSSQFSLPRPPVPSTDQQQGGPRVIRSSVLPLPADQVWLLMLRPATMLYVLHGLLDFPRLKDRHRPIVEGESRTGRVRLFHLVPFARWSIHVHTVDADSRVIATEECGGMFRRWTHTLRVEPVDAVSCRYIDIVEVEAGVLTPVAVQVVDAIFWHRHRRWRRLATAIASIPR
ncbi:MAG: hypothetical protein JWP48_3403 [Actinoallomurus sp.]|jgi:hypothetical protein|nr:hypothetical protein [Actinoallomurus sp.]